MTISRSMEHMLTQKENMRAVLSHLQSGSLAQRMHGETMSPSVPACSRRLFLGTGVRNESDKSKIGAVSPGQRPRFAGGALSGCPGELGCLVLSCLALGWTGVDVEGAI